MYKVEIVFKNGDKRYTNIMGIVGYLKELYTFGWFNESAGLSYPPHMIEFVSFQKQREPVANNPAGYHELNKKLEGRTWD